MILRNESLLTADRTHPEVRRLINLGQEKGYISYVEIQQILPQKLALSPQELEKIYLLLEELDIRVPTGEKKTEPCQGRSQAEGADPSQEAVEKAADPVRMYLREMGTVKLLDREGEIAIAKRIERAEAQIYQALADNPVILEELLKIFEPRRKDLRAVTDIVQGPDEWEIDAEVTERRHEILSHFRRIAALDGKIKTAKLKLMTRRRGKRTMSLEASIDQKVAESARLIKRIGFTTLDLNRLIGMLTEIEREFSAVASATGHRTAGPGKQSNPGPREVLGWRPAKSRRTLEQLEKQFGVTHPRIQRPSARFAKA